MTRWRSCFAISIVVVTDCSASRTANQPSAARRSENAAESLPTSTGFPTATCRRSRTSASWSALVELSLSIPDSAREMVRPPHEEAAR